ncbi:MAG: tRNA lysidine(34) synthetase TilS [Ruminococcaceae bacterium]|nr:tRNA lysidine(34) synthetase TilS [Oscillospiraceae bacterium]
MSEILTKIDETVKKYNMLTDGDTVVVGVSGGADSMLLLDYLLTANKYNIIVAHIEHGIRGETSIADCRFVEDFCKNRGIRFEKLCINAPKEAKTAGMGVEEYSRNRRYEFFNSFNPDKIAVAHNLSDSIETALFRIARGTSIKGLAGIPPVRDNIIRPLINCRSEEIRNACEELGIKYVVDETNSDIIYTRNYIRNVIVPEFKKLNPSFEDAVCRLINSSAEDNEFIEKCADECINNCVSENGMPIDKLKECSVSVIKRVIYKLCSEFDVSPDEQHLNDALDCVYKSKKVQIKGDVYISSLGGYLRVYRDTVDKNVYSIEVKTISISDFNSDIKFDFYCDSDKIAGEVKVRFRKEGDAITPIGRNCTKTLKKLFNELKIPAEKRSDIPVIADENGVIAVLGYAVDTRVAVDKTTKQVALFTIKTED